ncbi:exodeoxyribonuclease VII small subunit [Aquicoccus sp. SU-CL01552]|uniref:exodeoxyribonuclease VII small subunit n=1 Tax=Aquicoccus sp. SU-CL01552 TaxID=3127656 RepID=UPI003101D629
MTETPPSTPVEKMSFEQAMKELESVVDRLERGEVALEESIALYERGAKLKKRCEDELKRAEEKVAAITLDADGTPTGIKPVEGQ